MSDEVKLADAFLCPRDYPAGYMDRDFARNSMFGPALGSDRVHSCQIPAGTASLSLVRRISMTDIDSTPLQYAKNDIRHPEMCHEWFVAKQIDEAPFFEAGAPAKPADFGGAAILIGFKKEDTHAR